ncbi:MAG: helicase-associated domain-containing protein, partial [Anaerolineales bacterium]
GMRGWTEWSGPDISPFDLDLAQARRTLLEQLRLLEPMSWVPMDRFLNHLATVVPRLLFDSRTSHLLRASDERPASIKGQGRSLTPIQAAFVDHALSGPLHWMGLLDTSSEEDRLLAFRVNFSAAPVLDIPLGPEATGRRGNGGEEELDAEYKVIVQPNFQIFALGPVPADILARLEMFADRIKADRSAIEYLLSRQTVYRGQQDGVLVQEIVAFLEQNSSVPLPQNVLRTLREWGQRHERIVFHRSVSLLQAVTPDLLEELWDDAALQMHFQRRLTPTVALIRGGRWAAVQEALLKRQMLPASSQDGDPCVRRVQATEDGALRPVHPGPDLLLEACLRRLAVEREGGFYVTEAAVTAALAGGMTVAEYLDRLAALLGGPIPPGLEAQIKAWGHYYGKASLREATLLEVKDAATAEELLADPELAAHLTRFAADPRGRTLLVRTDDIEALRSLLQDRGVELT